MMTKLMPDLINFFTLSIFIIIFIFYNWILLKWLLHNKQLFLFKITSTKRIILHLIFLLSIITDIFYVLRLRFLRIGFSFNIFEGVSMLQDYCHILYYTYNLSYTGLYLMLYPILLIILGLSIVVFWTLLVPNVTNILKQSIISLYLYLLQYARFKRINESVFDSIINTRLFIIRNFAFCPANLQFILNRFWRNVPVKLENLVYRSLIPYLFFYDLFLNFGNISTVFYVMPWFYIYTILRNLTIFLRQLILELDYLRISSEMYKNN